MTDNLEAFASKLNYPADAWPALSELEPENLAHLAAAIDKACADQSDIVDTAIGRYFPPFLRHWVIRRLRGRAA